MNEQKVSSLDVEAILANEDLMKKLAAKVLDIIQQKPDAGVVCQGYYCNMAKDDQTEKWKDVCTKKLDSLEMELEEGLAAAVAEDYPLNAEELDQVVNEIKTSEAYAGKLSRTDLSRAVSKVLADNEIMRRKGSAEAMKADHEKLSCTPYGPHDFPCASIRFSGCRIWGPSPVPCLLSGPFPGCQIWGGPNGDPCAIRHSCRGYFDTCPGYFDTIPDMKNRDWVTIPVSDWANVTKRLEEAVATIRNMQNTLPRR